ncbi:hypothetical protein [Devosia sp. XK-2]|uniref:hypothetical protein n=1 Tax=Devosia sp. XK-2 TaxID=3126689 RepID=UPI0030D62ADC
MMIPVFTTAGTNLPYVQEMDEYYISTSFVPFLDYENYLTCPCVGEVVAFPGDLGLVAFRRPNGDIFSGTIDTVVEYWEANEEEVRSDALFLVQFNRLIGANLQQSYDPWRLASTLLFTNPSQQALWVSSEMSLFQKQATIWRDINDDKKEEKESAFSGDIREYSEEYLIRWLANSTNITSHSWVSVWRNVVERKPFDSRLPDVALGWIFSNLVENQDIASVKWVLYSFFELQLYRGVDRAELAHFFCNSASESEYILVDLASSPRLLNYVCDFICNFADDDHFFMFLKSIVGVGVWNARVVPKIAASAKKRSGSAIPNEDYDPFARYGFSYVSYDFWRRGGD